jgi:membrane-associated protease RseP (regulator of RpoE activity)
MYALLAILSLGFLIIVHEGGHFWHGGLSSSDLPALFSD